MPYYGARGDYVGGRSNYYRGDPWLGAALGFVARKVGLGSMAAKAGRWVAGRITGSTVKRAVQAGGAIAAGTAVTVAVDRAMQPSTPELMPIEDLGGGGTMGGGSGGTQWVQTASGRRMRVRWSSTKGKWVAVRSLNPLNPKALNRALRRASGFEKFAKKTVNALYRTSTGATKTRKFKRK